LRVGTLYPVVVSWDQSFEKEQGEVVSIILVVIRDDRGGSDGGSAAAGASAMEASSGLVDGHADSFKCGFERHRKYVTSKLNIGFQKLRVNDACLLAIAFEIHRCCFVAYKIFPLWPWPRHGMLTTGGCE